MSLKYDSALCFLSRVRVVIENARFCCVGGFRASNYVMVVMQIRIYALRATNDVPDRTVSSERQLHSLCLRLPSLRRTYASNVRSDLHTCYPLAVCFLVEPDFPQDPPRVL